MENNQTYLVKMSGTVQGVGMRYFVYQNAKRYGVNGFVKNMRDGTVKMVMQGKRDVLDQFLKHIKKQSPGNIEDIQKDLVDDDMHYHSFEISF